VSGRRHGRAGRNGCLFIVGGGEDRKDRMVVLKRFIELCGGADARILVLTAASRLHEEMWQVYDDAFGALGVHNHTTLEIASREDASRPETEAAILAANGIFMTGGDQQRLMAQIGGTRTVTALRQVLTERNAVIGGTSAGASAMSEHMLFHGTREVLPQKGLVHLAAGLGFLKQAIVDQHFSERQRLGRLLSVVAQNPQQLGVGIDEDTALVIELQRSLEVVGEGSVTLVDGREMLSNYLDVGNSETLELLNVRLHLLPPGARYDLEDEAHAPPAPLREVLDMLLEAP
jgi:cyanophycinase